VHSSPPTPDPHDITQSEDEARSRRLSSASDAASALNTGLQALSLTTSSAPLEERLTDIAMITVQAIFGADGAGVTLLHPNQGTTIVASSPFVREIDTIQYRLGQGPCVSAVGDDRSFRSGSLSSDRRWPKFAARVGNLGVSSAESALSLPLRLPGKVIGSLNVYARASNAFDENSLRMGEQFAAVAVVAVRNIDILAQAQRYAGQLETALTSRGTIDQALGIIRSRTGASAEEAFDSLRLTSQRENRKVAEIAEQIVNQSVARARARQSDAGNPGTDR
jgi:transcriptional regulator with GAF, ATPase, and Fis domain